MKRILLAACLLPLSTSAASTAPLEEAGGVTEERSPEELNLPLSAVRAMILAVDTFAEGSDFEEFGIRSVTSEAVQQEDGGSEVAVTVDLAVFAEDESAATSALEALRRHCATKPWRRESAGRADVQGYVRVFHTTLPRRWTTGSAGSEPFHSGRLALHFDGNDLVPEPLPSSDASDQDTDLERYVRQQAALDIVGIGPVRIDTRSHTPAIGVRDVVLTVRPSRAFEGIHQSKIGNFACKLESDHPSARVTKLEVRPYSDAGDRWTFDLELTVRLQP